MTQMTHGLWSVAMRIHAPLGSLKLGLSIVLLTTSAGLQVLVILVRCRPSPWRLASVLAGTTLTTRGGVKRSTMTTFSHRVLPAPLSMSMKRGAMTMTRSLRPWLPQAVWVRWIAVSCV